MKVLVTGSRGFIGKNLLASLRALRKDAEILTFDRDSAPQDLEAMAAACGFVFHLAGVNRPQNEREFMEGNRDLTRRLVSALEKAGNAAPILFTSSIQAIQDNPYGLSKRAAEEVLREHERRTNAPVFIYRLPNAFGKGSRPNYNSAIATFCHNIARGLPVEVREPDRVLHLAYIDDILDEFLRAMDLSPTRTGADLCQVPVIHEAKLQSIADTIRRFQDDFDRGTAPAQDTPLERKLYATWLSFLPQERWRHALDMKCDHRGSFSEFLRLGGRGQVSINAAKPGVTKGGHWHHTKSEKFLVVQGKGRVRLRPVGESHITEFFVSGERLDVVEIPVGYTHDITNMGESDLITVMWASEPFDPEHPDTYFEPVEMGE